ncbi:hypothetical protein PssvBMR18_gp01 [Pseudomonas phage MR18]|nr:hypothetical protein PssvBMR18_gp01 [Pseudomonas phage MR18]
MHSLLLKGVDGWLRVNYSAPTNTENTSCQLS